ncbi:MAG: hypothetical protein AB7I25_07240 [Vicinamibacterales bacterium]
MGRFFSRMLGAATFNTGVYEDVEADPGATVQAGVVVALASLAAGFGASGWNADADTVLSYAATAGLLALLAWGSWAFVTFEVGSRLLPEATTRVSVDELVRTIGFSAAPAVFLAFGAIGNTTAVFVVVAVWLLATMVLAVRQALDYSTTARAIAVCVVGWALTLVFVLVLGAFFGPALSL